MAIRSLASDDRLILDAYFNFRGDLEVAQAYYRLGVPQHPQCTRRDAAVGQLLVQSFQHRLPNYGISMDGHVVLGRKPRKRTPGAGHRVVSSHLFTINWADSAPGLSWPEAYHAVLVPEYKRYVVIASQDGPDLYGCTDHAIGFFGAAAPVVDSAGEIIRSYWQEQLEWDQSPWEYLLDQGIVSAGLAHDWRTIVWGEG